MIISQKGIDLIKKFEGCRLKAYKDPANVWTIGFGHTKGVKAGDEITQEQADKLLRDDLAVYEAKVNKYSMYNWNQNQFDALVSFAYNIGSIDQLTSNGRRSIKTISEKIPEYCNANGKPLEGLRRRRKEERALFDEPVKASETKKEDKGTNTSPVEEKPEIKPQEKPQYVKGRVYTVKVRTALNVRKGAGFNFSKVGYYGLTIDGRKHANRSGALLNGTRVTCQDVKQNGSDTWIKIPSGWVCAKSGNNIYIV